MLENRIKYRHLQCFLEVARQGSVGRAADMLALTQPAVSKKLKELEEMLGVRLLERSKKGVELTQFGEVFLKYASASVAALREGADSIAQARQKGKTRLSVGVLPTVATSIMPHAVKSLYDSDLGVTLNLVSGPNSQLLNQLRVGALDLVVGRLGAVDLMSGLAFQYLFSERVAFVVRNRHPLARDGALNIAAISDYTMLRPSPESAVAPAIERLLLALGTATPKDSVETISDSFGKEYIRQTDAIWLISRGVVAHELSTGEFVELPIDTVDTQGPVGLTTRADATPTPMLQLLMNAIREAADHHGMS
ncbi:pca operon transcription factor PcaQ [Marinobacterium nitratireducens]|uniref:Pca operon transcription factor PcaQ n=1 Tax=Marinobacterium nitratireducens TaxID=518897 RepID=A0A918DW13_9GAMM|nr:pca operon transcription factor PcaQ [Marinobacterium nitratireducens]GGO85905.1 pca operon transcription factor PcaQ [Marinobacterium nitratireducens]